MIAKKLDFYNVAASHHNSAAIKDGTESRKLFSDTIQREEEYDRNGGYVSNKSSQLHNR